MRRNSRFIQGIVLGILLGFFGLAAAFLFSPVQPAFAVSLFDPSSGIGYASDTDLIQTIINIVRWVLGFMALVAVIMLIYAGFVWLTSGGNEDRIGTAKKTIVNAVIGLIIVMLAYAITYFVIDLITDASNGDNDPPGDDDPPGGLPTPFTLDWYSPIGDNASDCVVQLGFSDDPTSSSFESGFSLVIPSGKAEGETCSQDNECQSDKCDANLCVGSKVAGSYSVLTGAGVGVFSPTKLFSTSTTYRATASGGALGGIESVEGEPLSETTVWTFTTASEFDKTPPTVERVAPSNGATDVSRECSLQVDFSKNMLVSTLLDANALLLKNNPSLAFDKDIDGPQYLSATPTTAFGASETQAPNLDSNIITDTCGNHLDGDANGTEHPSYPSPPSTRWEFQTGTSLACEPEITNVTPNPSGYDAAYRGNGNLTINGKNFGIFGQVKFERGVTVGIGSRLCMTDQGRAARGPSINTCIVESSWTDNRIVFNANPPSSGGGSNGAYTGDVVVNVGSKTSESVLLTIQSPRIVRSDPSKGPAGSYVTLNGAQFGATQGRVWIRKVSDTGFQQEVDYVCSGTWNDRQVVIGIPLGIGQGTDYYLQVEDNQGQRSNGALFEVNSDALAPGICPWLESCGEVGNSKIITGRFTARDAEDTVLINNNASTKITRWQEVVGEIEFTLSDALHRGDNELRVRDNGLQSNALDISSPCNVRFCDGDPLTPQCTAEPGLCSGNDTCNPNNCECTNAPYVIQNSACELERYPSPNPKRGNSSVCLNSNIHVMFSEAMNDATLNTSNIILEECGDAGGSFDASKCSRYNGVAKILSIANYGDPALEGFTLDPNDGTNQNFQRNKWYRVRLTTAIQSDAGFPLQEEYAWTFETKDTTELCEAERLAITPDRHTFTNGQPLSQEFRAVVGGEDCQLIQTEGQYDWNINPDGAPFTLIANGSPDATIATDQTDGSTTLICQLGTVQGTANVKSQFSEYTCETDADCNTLQDGFGRTCSDSVCQDNKCTADITAITPNDGAVDDYVSVFGCFFSSYQSGKSKVEFSDASGGKVLGLLPTDVCSEQSIWEPNHVRVRVPQNAATGSVYLTAKTHADYSAVSDALFGVNSDRDLMDYICLEPTNGEPGTTVTLKGNRFGTTQGAVEFVKTATVNAEIASWTDSEIRAAVDYGTEIGINQTRVVNDRGDRSNTEIPFDVLPGGGIGAPCSDSPSQCEDNSDHCNEGLACNKTSCVCEEEDPGTEPDLNPEIAERDPAPNEENVCRNRSVVVTFDQPMDRSTITKDTMSLVRTHGLPCEVDSLNGLWDRMVALVRTAVFQQASANHMACDVIYDIDILTINSGGTDQTQVVLEPEHLLAFDEDDAMNYRVRVKGGADGVKSDAGMSLAENAIPVEEVTWEFEVGESTCDLSYNKTYITHRVDTGEQTQESSSDLFSCSLNNCVDDLDLADGNQHRYSVEGYTVDDHLLQFGADPGQLVSTWKEDDRPNDIVGLSPADPPQHSTATVDDTRSSGLETVNATTQQNGTVNSVRSIMNVELNRCDNPWPVGGVFPYVGGDDADFEDYHFSSMYCKDSMEEPMTVDPYSDGYYTPTISELDELLAEYYLQSPNTTGTVGVRVYENEQRLSPEKWFKTRFPDKNPGRRTTVDGYPAVESGNGTYISFSNLSEAGDLYANIMIVQYSEDAGAAIKNIYAQILSNMTFNTNMTSDDKGKVVNDIRRVNDLSDAALGTYEYFVAKDQFPDLTSGSFIAGNSTSRWPLSWSLLSNTLGTTLNKDPQNVFDQPDLNCPIDQGYDPETCWDDADKRFFCPADSHIYHYESEHPDADAYYYGNLEYTGPGSWVTGVYNPCSGDSSCSCYNYVVGINSEGFRIGRSSPF